MNFSLKCGIDVSDEQFKIIDHLINNPVTVVSAGAGTGKTYTTVAAVLEMIVTKNASLDQFVLITFTRKAAQELRERLNKEISNQIANRPSNEKLFWYKQQEKLSMAFVGTIHSFCHHILKTYGYEQGVARESDIIYSKYLLKESIFDTIETFLDQGKRSILDIPDYDLTKIIIEILEDTYNNNISLSALYLNANAIEDEYRNFRTLFCEILIHSNEVYQTRKKEQRKMVLDSHDLLKKVANLFNSDNSLDIIEKICQRFRYLFVDEFQDTDKLQKFIVDNLKTKLYKLLVVGDRKQAIYGFRSADASLMQQLSDESRTEILPLTQSRRPNLDLLKKQEILFGEIAVNYQFLDARLQSSDSNCRNIQGSIPPMIYITNDDQPHRIADGIKRLILDKRKITTNISNHPSINEIEVGDIAILFRSNRDLKDYEVILKELLRPHNIKVRSDRGSNFFRSAEIVATFRLLRLILNYPDDTALALAVKTSYLSHIDSHQREHEILHYISPYTSNNSHNPFTDWFRVKYPDENKIINNLKKFVRTMTVPQLIAELYESFNIYDYYTKRGNIKAIDNLEKLREKARYLCEYEQALTLRQFVNWLKKAILSDQDDFEAEESEDNKQKPDYIRLMTIHRSKGLEFPIVIIPEIQKPLYYSSQPNFLIIDNEVLELNLSQWGLQTVSARYNDELRERKRSLIEEEIRLLYVATTRAKNSVIFVGSSENNDIKEWWQKKYSWQDEIRKAKRSHPELY